MTNFSPNKFSQGLKKFLKNYFFKVIINSKKRNSFEVKKKVKRKQIILRSQKVFTKMSMIDETSLLASDLSMSTKVMSKIDTKDSLMECSLDLGHL